MNAPAQSERGNPVALTAEDARSILAHACKLAVDHIESIGTAPVAPAESGADPYTTSTQWSRRAIGLKVFLSLAVFGHRAYARQLEHDTALGTYIAECAEGEGWARINTTPLPVICLINPDADTRGADASWEWHAAVAADVVNSGQTWISPVRLAGRPALRICVTNHRSTTDDADRLIDTLAHARDRRRSPGAPRSTKRR